MSKSLHAKSAYVSGASRGIGRAIAIELASKGYNLALTCHTNSALLRELKEQLERDFHVQVLTFTGDVSDFVFMKSVADETLRTYHSLDCVVNNAGISHIGLLTDMTLDEWNRVINIDLNSLFISSKLFVPSMIQKKYGRIINISSMWGTYGASMEVAYSAAKGGVNTFTKALAKELAPSNISVNAITCGVIDTDMNKCFSEEETQALIDEIPAGRMAATSEVAKTVSSIIEAPIYMTGQIIGLDGGIY